MNVIEKILSPFTALGELVLGLFRNRSTKTTSTRQDDNGASNDTSAPILSPFHPLIVSIEVTAAALIIGGTIMLFLNDFGWSSLLGATMVLIGGSVFSFGFISHKPSSPRQAGMITLLDSPILVNGRPIVVGGNVFVIPFLMDSIIIDMDNQEHEVPVTVVSNGPIKVPIDGKVIATYRPDETDLADYNQAGNNMKKVASQLNGPVIAETRDVAAKLQVMDICQQGRVISDKLEEHIRTTLFQQKKLGLKLIMVRTEFPLPKTVQESMHDVLKEKYQRDAEMLDSQTITKIARQMQREDAIQHLTAFDGKSTDGLNDAELKQVDFEIDRPGGLLAQNKVFPFEHYRQAAERRRLIKDGKVTKIEGVNGSFAFQNVNPKN